METDLENLYRHEAKTYEELIQLRDGNHTTFRKALAASLMYKTITVNQSFDVLEVEPFYLKGKETKRK